jgi:Flp pilus assembly protein TadG
MRILMSILRRFRRDRSGNVAIVFALLAVPMLVAVGCAIDYSRANQIRSKLQSAADAASVGSIAKASPGFIAAGAMTSDGPVPAGVADATNIFTGYVANQNGFNLGSVTPAVVKSGGTLTSTVQFAATVPTLFLGLIGSRTVTGDGHVELDRQHAALHRLLSAARQFAVDGRRGDADRCDDDGQQHARPVRLRLPRLQQRQQLL